MKIILLFICFVFFNINIASAKEKQNICYIPKGCNITTFNFDAGGDDTVFNITEVTCKFSDGRYEYYQDKGKIRWSAILGLNRVFIAKNVLIKEHNENNLKCYYNNLELDND